MNTVEEIEEFRNLKRRERHLLELSKAAEEQIASIVFKKTQHEADLKEVHEKLKSSFSELNKNSHLIRIDDERNESSGDLNLKSTRYVSHESKVKLLNHMIRAHQIEFPDSNKVRFVWLKNHLEKKYDIKCRSVSTFFKGILDDYQLAGGNRNRSIALESEQEN